MVDVLEFQAPARDGRPAALRRAVELYQGALLDGFRLDEPGYEEWLTAQRVRLRQLALELHERLLAHETSEGRVTGGGGGCGAPSRVEPAA